MNFGKENEQVEFKESLSELDASLKDVCAILNKHNSGIVYYGVKNNGDAKGLQIGKDSIRKIVDKVSEMISPKIVPIFEELENNVIKMTFLGDRIPYSYQGRHYIRVGDASRLMSEEQLIEIIQNMNYSTKWENIITGFTLKDVDNESLREFYYKSTDSNRLDLKKYDKEELLTYLGLMKKGKLNNAGYYLFGKKVNINLKLSILATNEKIKFIDLKEQNGNIYRLVDIALSYVYQNIKWEAKITNHKREDVPEIPESAIREIIINSFAHAQYESNTEHEICIYPNRIEIYNPGVFPLEYTPEDYAKKTLPTIIRNTKILDVLFRSKDVEKGGTGFKKVYELCKEKDIKCSYEKMEKGFKFIFFRNIIYNNLTNIKLGYSENFTFDELTKLGITHDNIKNIHKVVYLLIKNNNNIKKYEISSKLQKSEKTIQRILSSLISNGYISRTISGQDVTYTILKDYN